jgi:hypothetical protein
VLFFFSSFVLGDFISPRLAVVKEESIFQIFKDKLQITDNYKPLCRKI